MGRVGPKTVRTDDTDIDTHKARVTQKAKAPFWQLFERQTVRKHTSCWVLGRRHVLWLTKNNEKGIFPHTPIQYIYIYIYPMQHLAQHVCPNASPLPTPQLRATCLTNPTTVLPPSLAHLVSYHTPYRALLRVGVQPSDALVIATTCPYYTLSHTRTIIITHPLTIRPPTAQRTANSNLPHCLPPTVVARVDPLAEVSSPPHPAISSPCRFILLIGPTPPYASSV